MFSTSPHVILHLSTYFTTGCFTTFTNTQNGSSPPYCPLPSAAQTFSYPKYTVNYSVSSNHQVACAVCVWYTLCWKCLHISTEAAKETPPKKDRILVSF